MLKSLLPFIVFCLLIGVAAVWLIEFNTNTEVVSRGEVKGTVSSWQYQARTQYYKMRIKTRAWWSRMRAEMKKFTSDQEPMREVEVLRWQDHNGVWHFEEAKPSPDPTQ